MIAFLRCHTTSKSNPFTLLFTYLGKLQILNVKMGIFFFQNIIRFIRKSCPKFWMCQKGPELVCFDKVKFTLKRVTNWTDDGPNKVGKRSLTINTPTSNSKVDPTTILQHPQLLVLSIICTHRGIQSNAFLKHFAKKMKEQLILFSNHCREMITTNFNNDYTHKTEVWVEWERRTKEDK